MILGNGLLWFSTISTAVAIAAYSVRVQSWNGRFDYLRIARFSLYASALGLLSAVSYLWILILRHQFQFDYVFRYSSLDMPIRYLVTALWGGQEGTFLLWATYGGLLALVLRFKGRRYEPPVQVFFMGINFFLLLMLLKRSPFVLLDGAPEDGTGLNPLLQDPWMTIHPPVMFLGFASLGIPAAYAMAAMLREDWDDWVRLSMPWTVLGVLALGAGLTLGGYWSYSILGWGGYWGWDPVENSSLVPWLLAVALLHNQVIQLRSGRLRRINVVLAMLPFLFLVYSTFLTRSGILADFSVHSFTDLGINQFLVGFLLSYTAAGLGLAAFKIRKVPTRPTTSISADNLMLVGSLAFAVFGAFVCLGTSAPLITKLWGGPANVQPEFYNDLLVPFVVLVSVAMAVVPRLAWPRTGVSVGRPRLLWPALLSIAAIPLYYWAGMREWLLLVTMTTATLALVSNLQILVVLLLRRGMTGGYLAHVGVGLMILGIAASSTLDRSTMVELKKGEEVKVLGHSLRYNGSRPLTGGKRAFDVTVASAESRHVLSPLMYYTDYNGGLMKKPAIKNFFTHDLYLAPVELRSEPYERRVQRRLVLAEEEVQPAFEFSIGLNHLEIEKSEENTRLVQVAAHLQLEREGASYEIVASGHKTGFGELQAEPVSIPGSDYRLLLDGVDLTNKRIRLDLQAVPLSLEVGKTGHLQDFEVTFHGFDTDMGGNHGRVVSVFANTEVSWGSERSTSRPGIITRAAQGREYVEAPVGDTGLNLIMTGVDAAARKATFYVAPPAQESFWVEASRKPFIILLWAGTALVMVGLLTAARHRWYLAKDSRLDPRREPGAWDQDPRLRADDDQRITA